MIPRIIRIKNFLSYGPVAQVIDFSHHQFICLSGKNGHGKSALLDAITWVLWGQARKMNGVARADEHLVHLGQDHMAVSFDFECNQTIYRAIREYSKARGKKTLSELQFGVLDPSTNDFIAKTGKTTRETQETIIRTLGLSFEGCINSIFLRQGQSHEFSKKSPQERKEVLSSILGLTYLEELREKVLAVTRELTREKLHIEGSISELQEKIKESIGLEEQITEAKNKQCALSQNIYNSKKALQKALHAQNCYHEANQKLQILSKEKEITKQHVAEQVNLTQQYLRQWQALRKELVTTYKTIRPPRTEEAIAEDINQIQKNKEYIIALQRHSNEIQYKLNQLEQQHQQKLLQASQQFHEKAQVLATRQHLLEQQRETLVTNQQTLEKELITYPALIKKTENIEPSLLQRNLENSTQRYTHTTSSIAIATREIARISQAQKELREIQVLLDHADAHCPTCSQTLTTEQKHSLQALYKKQAKTLEHRYQRQKIRNEIAQKLSQKYYDQQLLIRRTIHEYEQNLQSCKNLEEKKSLLQKLTEEQQKISLDIIRHQEQKKSLLLEKDESMAALDKTYTTATERIHLLEEQQKTAIQVQTLSEQLSLLDEPALTKELQALRTWKTAQELSTLKKEEKKRICLILKDNILRYKSLNQTIEKLTHQIDMARKELPLHDPSQKVTELQEEADNNTHAYAQATSLITILETKQAALEKLRGELQTAYTRKQSISTDLEEYQILSAALGKNGIQALIIESVLPELEIEANEILKKLSDNNTQVLFESIKDLKNGNSRETLDIHISDNMGIRPYELFSGGEAFRIDFALRIALSKLLAKRSGKPLQTLIIDEGFGSQDEAGLEKILEALHRIQNDFEKVIVVSHLTEMKNQFPANFIIEKTAAGSRVSIAEQW